MENGAEKTVTVTFCPILSPCLSNSCSDLSTGSEVREGENIQSLPPFLTTKPHLGGGGAKQKEQD